VAATRTGFDHAADVRPSARAIDIPEMHFQPRQPILEPAETIVQVRFDALGDVFGAHQSAVSVELDLHDEGLCSLLGSRRPTDQDAAGFPLAYIGSPGSSLACWAQLANCPPNSSPSGTWVYRTAGYLDVCFGGGSRSAPRKNVTFT